MQIAEILADETLRQQEFPVARTKAFLAHAGVCPLPLRVAAAIEQYAGNCTLGDQEDAWPEGRIIETRTLAARLIGAQPDEVALVGPTSLALSYVAAGLPLRKHDNIVVYFDDYPSNVYPWMALAERGIEVRFLNIRHLGRIRAIDVQGQVDENTRLVALASNHFIAGWRIDIDAIGQFLRGRGILFCVDGIQTLGAFPTSVKWVDFLAADAHKWLLGPCAAGIFYVRKEVQDQLAPIVYGWNNVRCPNFVAQEQIDHFPSARRYEAGSANLLGIAGMHAGLELLLEIGVENIARELLRKRSWIIPALVERGCTVINADAPEAHASGIISFTGPKPDTAALHQRLIEAGIVTSLRTDRRGKKYIRLSPHFYNTDAELQRVIDMVS